MGDPVIANIMKSGAIMWYAPEGEAFPDETSIDAGEAWGGNWARVGYTNAPLTFTYEDTRMAIEVQEHLGELDEWRTKISASANTVLAELTADYFALLAGGTPSTTAAGASQKGYEQLNAGGEARVQVYAVGFEGVRYDDNENALPIRVLGGRATFKMDGSNEFSKRTDTYVNLPVMVKFLIDPTNSDALFTFQRVTAPASS